MMFRVGTITVLITLAWGGELQAQAGPGEGADAPTRTIFEGATVIDGTGAAARADMAVVVEGELITAVVPAGELGEELREGAEIVDASDWFAIPGLIEAHTHVATMADRARAEFILNRQLYAGITTARDMAGDVRSLMDLQRASLVKEIDAPDLHFSALMAGPEFFTDPRTVSSAAGETPGAVSWMQAVTGETDLAEAVGLARGTWATGIKTYAAIEGDLLAAITAEAARGRTSRYGRMSISALRGRWRWHAPECAPCPTCATSGARRYPTTCSKRARRDGARGSSMST